MPKELEKFCRKVPPARFELATCALGKRCSILLSYEGLIFYRTVKEWLLSWKPTCVIATPQNQVVGLRDDDQFFVLFHRGLRCSSQQQVEAQAVKRTGGDFQISTAFGGMG